MFTLKSQGIFIANSFVVTNERQYHVWMGYPSDTHHKRRSCEPSFAYNLFLICPVICNFYTEHASGVVHTGETNVMDGNFFYTLRVYNLYNAIKILGFLSQYFKWSALMMSVKYNTSHEIRIQFCFVLFCCGIYIGTYVHIGFMWFTYPCNSGLLLLAMGLWYS